MWQSCSIATKIDNNLCNKQYLKLIETKVKEDNLIIIGDTLKAKIHYLDDGIEKITIKLTSNFMFIIETENDIQ